MTDINKINTNKYFIGTMMIILTIGGRFIIGELSDKQRERINTPTFRRVFIFCAFFMATRDILIAIIMTIIFTMLLSEILKDDVLEGDDQKKEEKELDDIEKDIIYTSNLGAYI